MKRSAKIAVFICVSLLSTILFISQNNTFSIAELTLLTKLQVKKSLHFITGNSELSITKLSRTEADSYQQIIAFNPHQLQRQLDAQLQAAIDIDAVPDTNLYLNKALILEQQSNIPLDSLGSLIFTRAMLRLYLNQQQQALDLLILSSKKFSQAKSDQLLHGEALNRICSLQIELGFIQAAQQWCEQFGNWARQSEYASTERLSNALSLLANLKLDAAQYEQAKELFLESTRLKHEVNIDNLNNLIGLAAAYGHLHQFVLAEKALLDALEILKENPTTTSIQISQLFHNIADNQEKQGKYEVAYDYAKQAMAKLEKSPLSDDNLMAAISNQLGSIAQDLLHYEAAKTHYQAALTGFQAMYSHDHPHTATVLNNLGSLYSNMENYEKSKEYYEAALAMRKKIYGELHVDVIANEQNLALIYDNMDDMATAISLYEKSLASMIKLYGAEHPNVSVIAVNLGRAYLEQDDPRAEQLLQTALINQQNQLGANHPKLLPTLYGLAKYYREQKRYTNAELLYLRGLKIAEQSLPELHPDIAAFSYGLGRLYQLSGNYTAAADFYHKELAILRQSNSPEQDIETTLKRLTEVRNAIDKSTETQRTISTN